MATKAYRHYNRNRDEYDRISAELDTVRGTFRTADTFDQKVMLFDSSVFAVMSVQNSIDMLRKAFRGYARADSWTEVREVCKRLNYGNNKYEYIRNNFDKIFHGSLGDEIIEHLIVGQTWEAVSLCTELSGISWVKGAFVPAMLGFKDVMCIDTNVEQAVDGVVPSKGYDDIDQYRNAVRTVQLRFGDLRDEVSTFMLQWIVFDAQRDGTVTYHEEWFEHMLPGTPFGRQTALDAF